MVVIQSSEDKFNPQKVFLIKQGILCYLERSGFQEKRIKLIHRGVENRRISDHILDAPLPEKSSSDAPALVFPTLNQSALPLTQLATLASFRAIIRFY